MGAEIAQVVPGFSRISPEVFRHNKHAGLYLASIGRKVPSTKGFVAGKSKRKSIEKGKFNRMNGKSVPNSFGSGRSQVNSKKGRGMQKSSVPPSVYSNPIKVNYWTKNSSYSRPNTARNGRLCKSWSRISNQKKTHSFEYVLCHKIQKVMKAIDDYAGHVEGGAFSSDVYQQKLEMLNQLVWGAHDIKSRVSEARSHLISNQVDLQKAILRKQIRSNIFKHKSNEMLKNKNERNKSKYCKLHFVKKSNVSVKRPMNIQTFFVSLVTIRGC